MYKEVWKPVVVVMLPCQRKQYDYAVGMYHVNPASQPLGETILVGHLPIELSFLQVSSKRGDVNSTFLRPVHVC